MRLIATVFFALFFVGAFGADVLPNPVDKTPDLPMIKPMIKPKPTKTTTKAPETSTVTESTSTSTTEVSTSTSTTTTVAPSSTTSTTQEPITTSTSTEMSSTTTQRPITTTVKPEPPKNPEVGTWKYFDKDANKTCIMIKLAAQLNFTYTTNDNKTARTIINIPVNETSIPTGNCGNGKTDQFIVVSWQSKTLNQTNSFAYTFGYDNKSEKYFLREAVYAIFTGDLPNGLNETLQLTHNGTEYTTAKGYSYHCTRVQSLNLTSPANQTVGVVHISKVQLEAYHDAKTADFSAIFDCDAGSETPDYVPIAVGISLIALVVIVLVAYLVGRRRAQASGYVSM